MIPRVQVQQIGFVTPQIHWFPLSGLHRYIVVPPLLQLRDLPSRHDRLWE